MTWTPSLRPAWSEWLTNVMLREATAVMVKLLTRSGVGACDRVGVTRVARWARGSAQTDLASRASGAGPAHAPARHVEVRGGRLPALPAGLHVRDLPGSPR